MKQKHFSFAWQYETDGMLEVFHTNDAITAWWVLTQIYTSHRLSLNFREDGDLYSNTIKFAKGKEVRRQMDKEKHRS